MLPTRLNNGLTFFFFPQNENARRGMANDKYQNMCTDLEAEKDKTAILKEQIIKNKSLFSFCAFRLGFVPTFSEYSLCTLFSPTLQNMLPRPRTLSSSPSISSSWTARTRSLRRRGKKC